MRAAGKREREKKERKNAERDDIIVSFDLADGLSTLDTELTKHNFCVLVDAVENADSGEARSPSSALLPNEKNTRQSVKVNLQFPP